MPGVIFGAHDFEDAMTHLLVGLALAWLGLLVVALAAWDSRAAS